MSSNKRLVESYLASTDRSKVGPLLADDAEWVEWGDGVPAAGVRHLGRDAILRNYGDDELETQVSRLTEEGRVVVAEGSVRVRKKDGREFHVRFCDIFEIEDGRVKRKSSFGALLKDASE